MRKVSVIALKEDKERIVDSLHEAGLVEVIDITDRVKTGDMKEYLEHDTPAERSREASGMLIRTKWVLDVFSFVKIAGKK